MIKVLIIDDEPLISKMYEKALLLEKNKFEVFVSNGGYEGMETAKRIKPDIILLDIMMPETNGIQVLEKLKSEETTKNIPVVVSSNLSDKPDINWAKEKGAVDYWIKGELDINSLGVRIQNVLNTH